MTDIELDGVELTAKINLTAGYRHVNEDGDGVGPTTILDAIIDEAARQLLSRNGLYSSDLAPLRTRIEAIRDEEIRARVVPLIDAAFDRDNIPLTNMYGEPTGRTASMTELILDHVQREVKFTPVNRSGYRESESVMTKLIKDEIDRKLATELKGVVDAAKAELRNAIAEQGSKVLAETISRLAGVPS